MGLRAAIPAVSAVSAIASVPAGPALAAVAAAPAVSTRAFSARRSAAECPEAAARSHVVALSHVVHIEAFDGSPRSASALPTSGSCTGSVASPLLTGMSNPASQAHASRCSETARLPQTTDVLVGLAVQKESEAPVPAVGSRLPGSRMRTSVREAAPVLRPARPRLASNSKLKPQSREQEDSNSQEKDGKDDAHDDAAHRARRHVVVPALLSHVADAGHFVCSEPLDAAAWGIQVGTGRVLARNPRRWEREP